MLTKRLERENITYTISIQNYSIKNVIVTNSQLQSEIHKQLLGIETNKFNIVETITNIGLYELPTSIIEGSDNALLITQRFEKYFGQKPLGLSEKEGEFLIEFRINNIVFV